MTVTAKYILHSDDGADSRLLTVWPALEMVCGLQIHLRDEAGFPDERFHLTFNLARLDLLRRSSVE